MGEHFSMRFQNRKAKPQKFTGARKNIRQELNPAGIHGNQLVNAFVRMLSGRFDKIIKDASHLHRDGEFTVDRPRVEVIEEAGTEIFQGEGRCPVCEAFDTRNQTGTVTEGSGEYSPE